MHYDHITMSTADHTERLDAAQYGTVAWAFQC